MSSAPQMYTVHSATAIKFDLSIFHQLVQSSRKPFTIGKLNGLVKLWCGLNVSVCTAAAYNHKCIMDIYLPLPLAAIVREAVCGFMCIIWNMLCVLIISIFFFAVRAPDPMSIKNGPLFRIPNCASCVDFIFDPPHHQSTCVHIHIVCSADDA